MSAADIPRRSHVASANTPGAASPPQHQCCIHHGAVPGGGGRHGLSAAGWRDAPILFCTKQPRNPRVKGSHPSLPTAVHPPETRTGRPMDPFCLGSITDKGSLLHRCTRGAFSTCSPRAWLAVPRRLGCMVLVDAFQFGIAEDLRILCSPLCRAGRTLLFCV